MLLQPGQGGGATWASDDFRQTSKDKGRERHQNERDVVWPGLVFFLLTPMLQAVTKCRLLLDDMMGRESLVGYGKKGRVSTCGCARKLLHGSSYAAKVRVCKRLYCTKSPPLITPLLQISASTP